MQLDANIRDQAYQFFIQESLEFLQILEDGLLGLQQNHDTAEIHAIMRAAHSIKGGAASVGLEAIKKIAHQMEDVLRALYKDTVTIDAELEELLLQAYDCLRTPLIEQIQTGTSDGEHWLAESEAVFGQLVERLGDAMLGESELPTAAELGIDIVQVIFSGDVEEGLTRLESVLADAAHPELAGELRAQAQVFLGVGELVNLTGFVAIAKAAEAAIEAHPQQARAITQVALDDFRAAQQQVLAGDRAEGGAPSPALLQWSDAAANAVGEDTAPGTDAMSDPELTPELDFEPVDPLLTDFLTATVDIPAADQGGPESASNQDVAAVFSALAEDVVPAIESGQINDALAATDDALDFWAAAADDEFDDNFDILDTVEIALNPQTSSDLPSPLSQDALPDTAEVLSLDDLNVTDSVDLGGDALIRPDNDGPDASLSLEGLTDESPLDIGEPYLDSDMQSLLAQTELEADDSPPLDTMARQVVQADTVMESWDSDGDAPSDLPAAEVASADFNRNSTCIEPIELAQIEGLDDASLVNPAIPSDMVVSSVEDVAAESSRREAATTSEAAGQDLANFNAMMADLGTDVGEDEAWPDVFALTETAEISTKSATAPPSAPELPVASPAPLADDSAAPAASPIPVTPSKINVETVSVALKNSPPAPAKVTAKTAAKAAANAPILSNAIRVDLERLDRLNNLVGEMVSQENSSILQNQQLVDILRMVLQRVSRFDHLTRELRSHLDGSQTIHSQIAGNAASTSAAQSEIASEFDPLQMDNYSDLSLLMQETIDEIAQIGEAMRDMTLLTRNAQQTQRHKQQTLREVRGDLLWARMLPIGDILQRFPRMIRDMSRKHGKSVSLNLSGSSTLVDKGMLERLYDPLVHLVRNAFDHGIETIDQRRELGKAEEATIEIRAYHRGSQIYIEIVDDGRGIDPERVLQKALSKGLVTPVEAAAMEPEAVYDLLFTPGFSTVDIVSELSGRGVGLDTVRSQIKFLKGSLSVTSEIGKGTTFTLRLPLTLTITKLLVFSIDDHLLSVPVDSLLSIVAAPVDQIQTLKNGQFYHWQEQFIPIYPQSIFAQRYALNHQSQEQPHALTLPTKGKVPLLMLAGENQTIALPVDTILYERELAIKPFGKAVTPPPYLYGCTLLGDGSLVPVLDAQMLISAKQAEIVTQRVDLSPSQPVVDIKNATILVIDDSLTTRQTLAAVLQKAGYRVLQAKDGREGVEQLAQHAEIQAVFCDIEMPRMNGFEFLNSCRQDYESTILPVIMLSSRSNEKHRQVAKYMGANEYLTKPFLEPELLEVLTALLQSRAQAMTASAEPVLA